MKRSTALRYSRELARRVHEWNGVVLTPTGNREGMLITKMWIFGSTAKGSQTPNDLDLLIEFQCHGAWQRWEDVGFNPEYLRRYGMYRARDSRIEALKALRKGMLKVSCHCTDVEMVEIDIKKMIYPDYEMPGS